MNGDKPWNRRDGESPRAFAAFEQYVGLSASQRSIAEAWRAQHGRETGASPGYWRDWAKRHHWEERARARDAHISARLLGELVEERRQLARGRITGARMMLARGLEALGAVDAAQLSPTDAIRFLEASGRLSREAATELAGIARSIGPRGEPLAELRDLLSQLALDGDIRAAGVLVQLEERLAKAAGTDQPIDLYAAIEIAIARAAQQPEGDSDGDDT